MIRPKNTVKLDKSQNIKKHTVYGLQDPIIKKLDSQIMLNNMIMYWLWQHLIIYNL